MEKLVAGASYKNFTCPNPATRFSARSTRTVNVCLRVAHKPGATEHVTLVWERNGGFAGSGDELVPLRARPTDSQMTPTPTNTAKHTSATRT